MRSQYVSLSNLELRLFFTKAGLVSFWSYQKTRLVSKSLLSLFQLCRDEFSCKESVMCAKVDHLLI